MPLRLNLGIQKKIGRPDYGSLGASCSVELELSGDLIQHDIETFHRHVRNAYIACVQSVNNELARHTGGAAAENGTHEMVPPAPAASNGHNKGATSHRASQKQVEYANQLAGQIRGLGVRRLETLAGKMFAKPLADLSSLEASGLIDVLKDIKGGKIELVAALNGAQA